MGSFKYWRRSDMMISLNVARHIPAMLSQLSQHSQQHCRDHCSSVRVTVSLLSPWSAASPYGHDNIICGCRSNIFIYYKLQGYIYTTPIHRRAIRILVSLQKIKHFTFFNRKVDQNQHNSRLEVLNWSYYSCKLCC